MNKDKFFIGVGPGKTGSTWLHYMLNNHPEVRMPPIKELRYFLIKERIGKVNLFAYLFNKKRKRRLLRFAKMRSYEALINSIKQIAKLNTKGIQNLYFVFKFFCLPQNDKWYINLFPKNKISGDISPQYVNLSEKSIQQIKKLNPKAKLIFGLRNPIERTWSAIKMLHVLEKGKRSILEVEKETIYTVFKKGNIFSPNNYTEILKKWKKYFPENQIFIYYYEELEENPQKLFNKICEFLEIEPIKIEGINKRVNKGIVEEIPAEYEKEIIKHTYKYIKEFAQTHPNKYSLAWLEKYKNKL